MLSKKGFTLIELVVVIVIISILSAIALPKFVDLDVRAKAAVLKGALSAMKSAARIGNIYARTEPVTASGNVLIGNREILMINDYPVGRPNTLGGVSTGGFAGLLALMEVDAEISVIYSDNAVVRSALQAQDAVLILFIGDQCVAYQPPQASGGEPNYSNGVGAFSPGTEPKCNSL
ncbi:prepilin-type N-terminal cleavage/methylation domain-containing protein [Reinekea sp.]|jgi:MSHA pilin protein MshA|uniref:prepilin-type N-terminal cleavage/methylation domain-containing protein n=1 Tax=Reinekea sp. TaxID=1970455 RepID=UPI002A7F87A2|nr:prepilin-type N-terminal cleavage/methylation domain-containing protein [Reinekea sp.]